MNEDAQLLARLRRGDEAAFGQLIDAHASAMLRMAMIYVGSRAVAEEVVQETWLGVLRGLDRFEGRSSLKTWLFSVLRNIAITRAARERRSVPFSTLATAETERREPAVDPDRFFPADHDRWPHHWALGPSPWASPEQELLDRETRHVVVRAIEQLPPAQRTVITLRDIEGWPSEEVCDALGVSEGNQRVLLHRARSRVRTALEHYYDAVGLTVA